MLSQIENNYLTHWFKANKTSQVTTTNMDKAKNQLPSPEEIKRAINAAGTLSQSTYIDRGYTNIMSYNKALNAYNKSKQTKPIKKVSTFWDKLSQCNNVSKFNTVLGEQKLISKSGETYLLDSINPSRMDQKVMMGTFIITDKNGVQSTKTISLKSLQNIVVTI